MAGNNAFSENHVKEPDVTILEMRKNLGKCLGTFHIPPQ